MLRYVTLRYATVTVNTKQIFLPMNKTAWMQGIRTSLLQTGDDDVGRKDMNYC